MPVRVRDTVTPITDSRSGPGPGCGQSRPAGGSPRGRRRCRSDAEWRPSQEPRPRPEGRAVPGHGISRPWHGTLRNGGLGDLVAPSAVHLPHGVTRSYDTARRPGPEGGGRAEGRHLAGRELRCAAGRAPMPPRFGPGPTRAACAGVLLWRSAGSVCLGGVQQATHSCCCAPLLARCRVLAAVCLLLACARKQQRQASSTAGRLGGVAEAALPLARLGLHEHRASPRSPPDGDAGAPNGDGGPGTGGCAWRGRRGGPPGGR